MKQITLHKKRYQCPERWKELSGDQKRQAETIIKRPMDHHEMRLQLLVVLLKIKPKAWARIKYEEVYPLINLVVFILDHFRANLYGPGDGLQLLTFGEFRRCEKWVNLYQGSKDADYKMKCLDQILCIIYRPVRDDYDENKHQDKREPYQEWKTAQYLEAVEQYSKADKEILAEQYFADRDDLMRLFPFLFKQGKKEARIANARQQGKKAEGEKSEVKLLQQKNDWIQVLRKVSQTPADFEKIDNLIVTDVLFDLNERIREMEEQKEKGKGNG